MKHGVGKEGVGHDTRFETEQAPHVVWSFLRDYVSGNTVAFSIRARSLNLKYDFN